MVSAPYRVVAEFIKDPESSFLYGDYIVVSQKTVLLINIEVFMSVYTQESKYVKKLAESPSYTDYLGKISNKRDHTLHI